MFFGHVFLEYLFQLFLCIELAGGQFKIKNSGERLRGIYWLLFIEAKTVQFKYQIHMWQNLILLQKSKKMKCILHQI